jgi:hypothetical protein
MDKEKEILNEVEKTLNAFDYDVNLEENPFLLTRIQARMVNKKKKRSFVPLYNLGFNRVLLLLILIINLVTLAYYYDKSRERNVEEQFESALMADFTINQSQNIF